jgi:hypothetical protein
VVDDDINNKKMTMMGVYHHFLHYHDLPHVVFAVRIVIPGVGVEAAVVLLVPCQCCYIVVDEQFVTTSIDTM